MDCDWILIWKMRQGSDEAWEQFIHKYYGEILKYCFYHCRDRECAEDLTQEVFLKFFGALARYQHRGKAKNYLYTIAANLCRDQQKLGQDLPLEAVENSGVDATARLDDRLMLEAAIGQLPQEMREVIVLHYFQGLKLSETAAVLGIGLSLVKYRLRRAKELLRKETEDGIE